jgi:hypothetical protein
MDEQTKKPDDYASLYHLIAHSAQLAGYLCVCATIAVVIVRNKVRS